MPLYKFMLLQGCKLFILSLVGLLFLPFLVLGIILISLSSFILLPLFCIPLSFYLVYYLASPFSVQSLTRILFNLCLKILENSPSAANEKHKVYICVRFLLRVLFDLYIKVFESSSPTANEENKIYQRGDDLAVSVEFDPLEFPSIEESEDEKREDGTEESPIIDEEGTSKSLWQAQIIKSHLLGEDSEQDDNIFHVYQGNSKDSWQTQFMKSFHIEDKPFYKTLDFWKRKEGERLHSYSTI